MIDRWGRVRDGPEWPRTRDQVDVVLALPASAEWQAAAAQERWVLPEFEIA
jgi:hypothetical protein